MSAKTAGGQTGWLPTLRRWLLIFLVMNLVGAAVALFLENGLGSDSIGLLCDGLHRVTGLSYGNASMLYNLAIIAAAAVFARGNLGAGTIVYALTSGYFIDFYCWLMDPFALGKNPFLLRFLGFAVGQIFLSLALAILIQMNLGMNALDALLTRLSQRVKLPYAALRTGADLTYVVIGTLMGGVFGIGTILSVLLTGTMIRAFTRCLSVLSKNR